MREQVPSSVQTTSGFISTSDQVADGFTNALLVRQTVMFRNNLNLTNRGWEGGGISSASTYYSCYGVYWIVVEGKLLDKT